MKIKLYNNVRPIFKGEVDKGELSVLLDTGAVMSVYTDSIENLARIAAVKDTKRYTRIGGFGGEGGQYPVYTIDKIKIGTLSIINLPIAVTNQAHISSDLVLASCVLSKHPFIVDYTNKELSLAEEDITITCKFMTSPLNSDIISSFCVFTQDELDSKWIKMTGYVTLYTKLGIEKFCLMNKHLQGDVTVKIGDEEIDGTNLDLLSKFNPEDKWFITVSVDEDNVELLQQMWDEYEWAGFCEE